MYCKEKWELFTKLSPPCPRVTQFNVKISEVRLATLVQTVGWMCRQLGAQHREPRYASMEFGAFSKTSKPPSPLRFKEIALKIDSRVKPLKSIPCIIL